MIVPPLSFIDARWQPNPKHMNARVIGCWNQKCIVVTIVDCTVSSLYRFHTSIAIIAWTMREWLKFEWAHDESIDQV